MDVCVTDCLIGAVDANQGSGDLWRPWECGVRRRCKSQVLRWMLLLSCSSMLAGATISRLGYGESCVEGEMVFAFSKASVSWSSQGWSLGVLCLQIRYGVG